MTTLPLILVLILVYIVAIVLWAYINVRYLIPLGAERYFTDELKMEKALEISHKLLIPKVEEALINTIAGLSSHAEAVHRGSMGAASKWMREDVKNAMKNGEGLPRDVMIELAVKAGVIPEKYAEIASLLAPFIDNSGQSIDICTPPADGVAHETELPSVSSLRGATLEETGR